MWINAKEDELWAVDITLIQYGSWIMNLGHGLLLWILDGPRICEMEHRY